MCINWSRIQTINNNAAKKDGETYMVSDAWRSTPELTWRLLRGSRAGYLDTTENTSPWAAQLEFTAELRTSRRPHTVQNSTAQHSVSAGRSLWAVLTRAWWLDLHAGLRSARHTVGAEGFTKLNNIFLNEEKLNLKCPEVAAEEARYSSEERDVTGRTELVIWS